MSLYDDSAYPVRTDLAAIHAAQLERLGAPGTWGSGAQRLAVAAAARQAGYDAGLLENRLMRARRSRSSCPRWPAGWSGALPPRRPMSIRHSTSRRVTTG